MVCLQLGYLPLRPGREEDLGQKKRVWFLITILCLIAIIVSGVAVSILYRTALNEERSRLTETTQSHARLMEAIARFDVVNHQNNPDGPLQTTLSQIRDAHANYQLQPGHGGDRR